MARIEISMSEYQSLKTQVNELYETKTTLEKDLHLTQGQLDNATELLTEIQEAPLLERLFKWKGIVQNITNFLITYNNKENEE